MTKRFQIENTVSGVILGIYKAEDAEHALEVMARDAGYDNYAECCEIAPADDGEIVVTDFDDTYTAVKTWVYSGGDSFAHVTFDENDETLARQLYDDWPVWSEGQSPYTIDELEHAFAELRDEILNP